MAAQALAGWLLSRFRDGKPVKECRTLADNLLQREIELSKVEYPQLLEEMEQPQHRFEYPSDRLTVTLRGFIGGLDGKTERLIKLIENRPKVHLIVDSEGGTSEAAFKLLEALSQKEVTAHISGNCFSGASIAVMAARRITIAPDGVVMIHNAQSFCCGGAAAFRAQAVALEADTKRIIEIYSARTGIAREIIEGWMRPPDRYFTAQEALAARLVDAITE